LISQLRDQQVRFAPRERKLEQVNKTEKLLLEIESEKKYSFEFISFRITGYRPDAGPHEVISGEDAQHDLRLFIEDVSDSADIPSDAGGEQVFTVDQLGKRFNVSTKTISRWRQQGLVSRRFVFNGRKRVGFLKSSVDRFVANNREKVERGAKFTQLSDQEREEIIHRARRLARAGGCPSDVTRRIAERLGRSVETIRYTLKEYDKQNKEMAIFPGHGGPLTDRAKEEIYKQHRRGQSAEMIARKHCRSVNSIYRILSEMRAHRIMELPQGPRAVGVAALSGVTL
jgi:RNA polymerase primary sigma factor/RNA polymerase sigma factor